MLSGPEDSESGDAAGGDDNEDGDVDDAGGSGEKENGKNHFSFVILSKSYSEGFLQKALSVDLVGFMTLVTLIKFL